MIRSVARPALRLADRLLIRLLQGYQMLLSPMFAALGSQCRFEPTCSQYMIDAVRARGALVGVSLGLWRIVRCNPFNRGGYDPAPSSELGTVRATATSAVVGPARAATRPESAPSWTGAEIDGLKPKRLSRLWTNPDRSGQTWTNLDTATHDLQSSTGDCAIPPENVVPPGTDSLRAQRTGRGRAVVGDTGQDVSRETF